MITRVSDIMVKDFITVDALDGLRKVQNFMLETGHNYFIVMEGSRVKGILNSRNLIKTHPNRLAIDALSTQFECVSPDVSLWTAKEKIEKNNCEILLVKDEGGLKGFITEDILNTELAKYFDPLTKLYRSEYIYHQGIKLISKGEEISIVFIDINNFGQINKKYGHIQGNFILKELGSLLKSNIPEGSFLCRFGGDEFVLLTPYYLEQCSIFTRDLLNRILTHKFCHTVPVFIAAGLAGGRRLSKRPVKDPLKVILNLINIASLESTKAKKEDSCLSVAQTVYINEPA